MKKYRKRLSAALLLFVAVIALTGWYLHRHTIAVLQPAGEIGYKERNLIIFCVIISTIVVIPVFSMLGYFAWKYREDNHAHAKYSPDLEGNKVAETIWWLVPTAIIVVISVVTWRSSYALDPFKPISSNKPTLHIQVVALDWKWLFIYPNQRIATVNQVAVPVNTPVDFELTSDTFMTSFWDPQLGGQMYAMPGMMTQLNLEANKLGSFNGQAANISGRGFAGMTFTVKSMPQSTFNTWVASTKHSCGKLTDSTYASLAAPSTDVKPLYYGSVSPGLYDTILMKYMAPTNKSSSSGGDQLMSPGMSM